MDISSGGDRFLVPPVYHMDFIRLKGTLTYNEFGMDFLKAIDSRGMETRVMASDPEDARRFRIFPPHVFISRCTPSGMKAPGI